jgi:hypothetical protein
VSRKVTVKGQKEKRIHTSLEGYNPSEKSVYKTKKIKTLRNKKYYETVRVPLQSRIPEC